MKANCLVFTLVAIMHLFSGVGLADVSRPQEKAGPTEVLSSIFVVDIDGIDTAGQNFTANVAMRATWQDDRLKHSDVTGKVVYPLTQVWHPRLQWINEEKVLETFPETVEVTFDGKVTYLQRVLGQFKQPLQLRDFPFDKQKFNVTLVAAGYTPDEVKLVQDPESPSGIAELLSVADWKIIASEIITGTYKPLNKIKSLVTFSLRFEAKRGSRYFALTIIIPLILIVAMSWVVFWIDPKESGTQIGVAMTSMLTLIAYRFAVAASLPKISYLTRMDIFLLGATFLVFSSLVEVVVTSYLARSDRLEFARHIDWVMRLLFPLALVGIFAFAFLWP